MEISPTSKEIISDYDDKRVVSYEMVTRIRLERGLPKACLIDSRMKVKVFMSDEFNQPCTHESLKDLDFTYYFIKPDELLIPSSSMARISPDSIVKLNHGNTFQFSINFPSEPGSYMLNINVCSNNLNIYIMSYVSDIVNVCSSYDDHDRSIILSCHRMIDQWEDSQMMASDTNSIPQSIKILIKEDYGADLGSHIYDCSIVLMLYFRKNFYRLFDDNHRSLAIELGVGCGLISIWLSKLFRRVIATDKRSQLPLLRHNVTLNNADKVTSTCELTWDRIDQVEAIIQSIDPRHDELNLIVAGDVFYDHDSIADFFAVVSRLIILSPTTCLIVAQKFRHSSSALDHRHQLYMNMKSTFIQHCADSSFTCKLVFEQADVIVWNIMAQT